MFFSHILCAIVRILSTAKYVSSMSLILIYITFCFLHEFFVFLSQYSLNICLPHFCRHPHLDLVWVLFDVTSCCTIYERNLLSRKEEIFESAPLYIYIYIYMSYFSSSCRESEYELLRRWCPKGVLDSCLELYGKLWYYNLLYKLLTNWRGPLQKFCFIFILPRWYLIWLILPLRLGCEKIF